MRGQERLHPHAVAGTDQDRLPAGRQLGERALHDDAAVIDDRDRVADLLHLVEQVRGEQHRAAFRDEAADHAPELVDAGRVEPVGRLVQDQQLRVGEESARDAQALTHPERVGGDAIVRPLGEADAFERPLDPIVRLPLPRGRDHGEVLATGQVAMEARLLDDRADAGERRGPLGRHRPP